MPDIVTLGEALLRLATPRGERLESTPQLNCRVGGAESNVAVTASRLGAETAWLSKLPDNPLGRRIERMVRSHGVEPVVSTSADGRLGTYYLERAGEPRGSSVIYDRANSAVTSATPAEFDVDLEASEFVFTTGITPALSATLFETTEWLLSADTTTAFDLNYRSKLWEPADARTAYEQLLPAVDVLFAPERDVRTVWDLAGDAPSLAGELRDRFDCETVVLTRGSAGSLASTTTGTLHQEAFETETVDPVGSGDAFVGAFLARRVAGGSVESALQWGAAGASLCRTMVGDAARLSPGEIHSVLEGASTSIDR